MNGLCQLPRISAIAMFATKQDLQNLKYVIDEMDIASDKKKWAKTFSYARFGWDKYQPGIPNPPTTFTEAAGI